MTILTRLLMVITVILTVQAPLKSYADNIITGMRVGVVSVEGINGLRLVLETKSLLNAKLILLQNPYRLVVDMPQTVWDIRDLPTRGQLRVYPGVAYRFGNPKPNISRLVIELKKPAAPLRVFNLPPSNGGTRFVIDLIDRGKTAFQVAASALKKNPNIELGMELETGKISQNIDLGLVKKPLSMPLPKSKPFSLAYTTTVTKQKSEKETSRKWVVFIDAGHGGKDPGAIGKAGTLEKNITLAAAKELALQLKATGKIRPVLARDDDRFLRLRQRIKLARRNQADLFISLHADSAQSSLAHGISVFTLSDKASDKEAAALARAENNADLLGGPDLSSEDPEAAGALVRMFQRESMNQSARFAASILKKIDYFPGGNKRGHRFAGFAVLKAPDMPSVLVEMGFLSNQKDEANLNKASYRRKLSRQLTDAILLYLKEYGPNI